MKRLGKMWLSLILVLAFGCGRSAEDLPKKIEVPCEGGKMVFEFSGKKRDLNAYMIGNDAGKIHPDRTENRELTRYVIRLQLQHGIATALDITYYYSDGGIDSHPYEVIYREFKNGKMREYKPSAVLDGKAVDIVTAWRELAAKDKRFTIRE